MTAFEISVRALPDVAEESTPTASVSIRANESVFTRLLRPGSDEYDDYLLAPPAQLAFWLVDNWWRVRWESVPPGGMSAEWRLAHELSSIGGGYVWPRLAIWGEGERIGLTSRSDPAGVVTPVRFLTDALFFVQGSEFESAVDRFLGEAVERWTNGSDRKALRVQINALRTERSDSEFTAWRRLEARLGFDPGDAPEDLMFAFSDLINRYGQSGVEEAAQAAPGPAAADTLLHEIQVTEKAHYRCDLSSATRLVPPSIIDRRQHPWAMAERASKLVRQGVGATQGPLRNKRLAEVLGTHANALRVSRSPGRTDLQYGLRLRTDKDSSDVVALRSRWSHDRRFEMSRALGDAIWAVHDDLGPMARSKTARQKFQRAFAQSLLCPVEDLLEYMNTDCPSEDDLSAAAKHFHVAERVVQTVLVNKKYADRDILERRIGSDGSIDDLIEAA